MSITINNTSGMEFSVSGNAPIYNSNYNRAVMVIAYILDPISDVYSSVRGSTEVARTTTDGNGAYLFTRTWLPGDYVLKYFGTETNAKTDSKYWEYFAIPQKGLYDVNAPQNSKIYKINY